MKDKSKHKEPIVCAMRVEGIRDARRHLTTTVALVTAQSEGVTNVMSAEWSLQVSLDPVLMAVFVGYERGTYDLIKKSGEFGLSYCSDQQAHLAHVAGNYTIRESNKFDLAHFPTFPSKHIAAPMIDNCISNFECKVVDELRVGDHAAFVGEILAAYSDDDLGPLVFHGGKFWEKGNRISKD